MVEKQSFGEPFIETHYIEKEDGFSAEGRCLLVNLDTGEDVTVNGEFVLAPLSAAVVKDAQLRVPGKALLICGFGLLDPDDLLTLDGLRAAWKSNWELSGRERDRGVPFYKSPAVTLGGATMNFCLVAEPDTPSGIHRTHPQPVRELHVQVAGLGAVDLLRSEDPESVYASLPLSAGGVHTATWDREGNYPWHRYRSVTRCIFLAVSIPTAFPI